LFIADGSVARAPLCFLFGLMGFGCMVFAQTKSFAYWKFTGMISSHFFVTLKCRLVTVPKRTKGGIDPIVSHAQFFVLRIINNVSGQNQ
jgi:hypothetical protein